MQDGGRLTPTFDDVINGLEAARGAKGGRSINMETIDEGYAIQCIEDVCRKRMAVFARQYDNLKESLHKQAGISILEGGMAAESVARKQSL